ncbi:hypothetical protein R8Z50_35615 [Longispora sp. K20-0274]|uniref:hypothetical protein n=1 Tax=Longispora sp. K20-0274 TaxID=3088255 RepID=UPI0039997AA3
MTQFPSQPPAPAARQRPSVVTAASGLLAVVAVLILIYAVVSLVGQNEEFKAATDEYYKTIPGGGGAMKNFQQIGGVVGVVINAVIALGFVALAFYTSQGKQVARILTWVFAGIASLCCICGAGSVGLQSALKDSIPEGAQRDAYTKMLDAQPGWLVPVSVTVQALIAISLLAAIIMLALPAANAYFRKPVAEWVPPTEQF